MITQDENAITLENISVRYRVPRERLSGIKEYTIRWLQRRIQYDDFWALDDVSFQVKKGEIFGVIGLNGAGKSTMLKVMARVLHPTRGRIVMRGVVAPLLELGGAFHPELTGRENVFLNSALLGRSRKQTEALFDSIVGFSEVGDFIDAPIRTYSTGMLARLGFSVATSIRPEILLVDEVLSVGDSTFQRKCLDRMYSFQDQGTTIVIVSHSMSTLEGFCERAVWLDNGMISAIGDANEIAKKYIAMGRGTVAQKDTVPTLTEVPVLTVSTPQAEPLPGLNPNYVTLPEVEHIYPAARNFNLLEGSLSTWLCFNQDQDQNTAIIFHSDDSRYVLYADMSRESDPENPPRRITARAGGNRKALDPFLGQAAFPEVVLYLDGKLKTGPDFPFGEWHLITMTWSGYPEGILQLYLDGILVGETRYTRHHDNAYRLAIQVAVGIRPPEWVGELIQREDGTVAELHPQATNTITGSGKEIRDVRLYRKALKPDEIQSIIVENKPRHG
jgi:ABC-2 type transport system ATP-binding protein/lipopolysaccharide transport system ATP-binding protein